MDFSLSEEQELFQNTIREFARASARRRRTAKLFGTNVQQKIVKLALDLIPDHGLCEPSPDEAAMSNRPFTRGRWVSQYMFSLAAAIAGGTSNIQRNIIGELVLGLPRDQRSARQ